MTDFSPEYQDLPEEGQHIINMWFAIQLPVQWCGYADCFEMGFKYRHEHNEDEPHVWRDINYSLDLIGPFEGVAYRLKP